MRPSASLASVVLLLPLACREDRSPATQDDSSSTGAASSSSSGEPVPDLPASDESTGSGWPLPTNDALLQCVRTCEGPWDCCPPGSEGSCPGPGFPHNYSCIEGVCVFPPCFADDDCTEAGQVCQLVRGFPTCVLPCDADEPCAAVQPTQTCAGLTDDGQAYCMAHCTTSGVFCGNQTCDEPSGECVCTSAGQCQVDWDCV